MMVIRDTLWVLHPEGNWLSPDGKSWTRSALPNSIGNHAFLDYLSFRNQLLGLGHLDGNIERLQFRPTVYSTSDFTRWDSVTGTSLPARFFYHPFAFKDSLWIIGGEEQSTVFADIITSPDGVHWQIVQDKLPFGPVSNSLFVFFKNKIWMLSNDVWSTTDGHLWVRECHEIVPGVKIFGYAAVVYDDKIWLLGCNRNGLFTSQILYSEDGKTWQAMDAPWSPRGGVAAAVFQDKIFLTGGKYGGTPGQPEFAYSQDLWVMEKVTAQ